MPLVALMGRATADQIEPVIDAILAAGGVGLCWMLLGRIGVARLVDRLWLTLLFGFSTQILWVTTRGGVWHTGHLVATILTFACLVELYGRQRAWLVGLLAGVAFLTRAPLAFAVPFYALMLEPRTAHRAGGRRGLRRAGAGSTRWRAWVCLRSGCCRRSSPSSYNQARFGTPLERGYALASLPPFLEAQRAIGLFSLAHVPMNLDYFLLHLPRPIASPPFFQPDGLGMSVLLTSPGLLFATQADWRRPRAWWLLGAAIAVLIPTLLYYGGGWLQYGYRYFLNSVPFVIALCGLAAVHRGRVGPGGGRSSRWGRGRGDRRLLGVQPGDPSRSAHPSRAPDMLLTDVGRREFSASPRRRIAWLDRAPPGRGHVRLGRISTLVLWAPVGRAFADWLTYVPPRSASSRGSPSLPGSSLRSSTRTRHPDRVAHPPSSVPLVVPLASHRVGLVDGSR